MLGPKWVAAARTRGQELVSEGLLEVQHGRGYFVSPPAKGLPATPPDMPSVSRDPAPAGQAALFRLLPFDSMR